MLGSHYSSTERGCAITQWILENSVSQTLLKPCRIRSVFLPLVILQRSLASSQFLKAQSDSWNSGRVCGQKSRAVVFAENFYTCFTSLCFHQIKSSVRVYIYAGGWVSGHCAERECSTLSKLLSPENVQKQWCYFSILTRSFLAFPLAFTLSLIYTIWWFQDVDLELNYVPQSWSSPFLLCWTPTLSDLLCPINSLFIAICCFILNSIYVFFSITY